MSTEKLDFLVSESWLHNSDQDVHGLQETRLNNGPVKVSHGFIVVIESWMTTAINPFLTEALPQRDYINNVSSKHGEL